MAQNEGSDGDKLLEGIASEAREEAERITAEAERQAEEIVRGARNRAESILEDAEAKGEEQAKAIRAKSRQNIETEERKRRLKAEERLFSKAMGMVHRKLEELRESDEYPEVVKGWIVEAALGLGVEEAEVKAPAREGKLIDEQLLHDAEEELRSCGSKAELRLAEEQLSSGQGVVVAEREGRLSYNNLAEARLQRYAAEVRRMIYEQIKDEPE